MFFFRISLLIIYFVLSPRANALDNYKGWTLAKQEEGITVYTRPVVNSDYPEFRGEMSINTNINKLLRFFNNPEHCPAWRYKCVKMLNLSDGYIYRLSSLPWPFSDRYTVMHSISVFDKQNNSYTIKLTNIKRARLPSHIQAQLPEQGNTVQMRYSEGYWAFKQTPSKDQVHIIYQMHGDADADLPNELIQLGIINSAYITLSNLKKFFSQIR